MPAYTWTCIACDASNTAHTEQCNQCGCPASASGRDADLIRQGEHLAPVFSLPTARLTIGRLATGSIFKLWLLGTGAAYCTGGVVLGLAALFGFNTVTWAGQFVHGVGGLALGLVLMAVMAVVFGLFFAVCSLLPLYFYSKKWPLTLTANRVTVRELPLRERGLTD